jgi:methylglutaconyl-CoA hydratase
MRKAPQLIIARIQGKCIGGGVGLAAAADYAIAYETAEVKLSELALGIGPFVIGPVVERKVGLSAYTQLAIDAALWRPADWARRKGLYAELHNDVAAMDESIVRLSTLLSTYSIDAMKQLKHSFWQGTDHWDILLKERAGISGKLILSEYSKNFIKKFKEKVAANA